MNIKIIFLIFAIYIFVFGKSNWKNDCTKTGNDANCNIDDVDYPLTAGPRSGLYSTCYWPRQYKINFDSIDDRFCKYGYVFRKYNNKFYCAKRCSSGTYSLDNPLRCSFPGKCYRGSGWSYEKDCLNLYGVINGCEQMTFFGFSFPSCGINMKSIEGSIENCFPVDVNNKYCPENDGYRFTDDKNYCIPPHYEPMYK